MGRLLTKDARMDPRTLFLQLARETDERVVATVISGCAATLSWHPMGGTENNYGVIENQQASPVAALIEKLTNSIDARLMRLCQESGCDPKGASAPPNMSAAIELFFNGAHKTWYLPPPRRKEAEAIQMVASGNTKQPCLLIYDDGEGQHPDDFEATFLSLLRGNKNEIPFVQGKYNMGGTGALVFCGSLRYQLIGSKRFDGTGDFGFTQRRRRIPGTSI
jgi:hypothetical protein